MLRCHQEITGTSTPPYDTESGPDHRKLLQVHRQVYPSSGVYVLLMVSSLKIETILHWNLIPDNSLGLPY